MKAYSDFTGRAFEEHWKLVSCGAHLFTNWHAWPAKTQTSLHIYAGWSTFAWRSQLHVWKGIYTSIWTTKTDQTRCACRLENSFFPVSNVILPAHGAQCHFCCLASLASAVVFKTNNKILQSFAVRTWHFKNFLLQFIRVIEINRNTDMPSDTDWKNRKFVTFSQLKGFIRGKMPFSN